MSTFFNQPGRFYKANLHTHSTESDGHRSPQEVCADYRARGYQVLAVTDHFKSGTRESDPAKQRIHVTDATAFSGEDFLTIPGAEIHGPGLENGELWHIVCVGLPLDFAEPGPDETGAEIARRARDTGAWVSLAHPHWNTVTEVDALAVADVIHSVEVYNHNCEVEVARGWDMHAADTLLQRGIRVQLNAADDAHIQTPGPGFGDAFGGWVMIRAEELTHDAIMAALRNGHFYSSTGPDIHDIELIDGTVRVRCSPVNQIVVTAHGSRGSWRRAPSLIDETFALPRGVDFIRVTIVDADGHKAWSNPVWLE